MKKIISIILAIITVFCAALSVSALDCSHSYSETAVLKNCSEKAHTLYTCDLCGHSYKVYNDEFTVPDSFYILAETHRNESTLTLTLTIGNNPGLTAARIKVGYDASTLTPASFINGNIWSDDDYTSGEIKLNKNPVVVLTEDYTTAEGFNTKNGTYFTVVFDIIDPDGDYGFSFTHAKADFHKWDYDTSSIISYTPRIIDISGASELGDHSYTEKIVPPTCTEDGYTLHTCIFCSDSYTDSKIDATGHSPVFSKVISEPTFENEGIEEYICEGCREISYVTLPVLEHWQKGDVNGDGKLNAADSNILKRIIAGKNSTLQELDAADITCDGKINSTDSFRIRGLITGS